MPSTIVLASLAAEPFCPVARSPAWVRSLRSLTARAFFSIDSVLMFTLALIVGVLPGVQSTVLTRLCPNGRVSINAVIQSNPAEQTLEVRHKKGADLGYASLLHNMPIE